MKVLFVATIMPHFKAFHEPYMKWFQEQGWEVHAAANDDAELSFCDKKYHLPIERSPFKIQNINALSVLKKIIEKEQYDIIHCHTPMGSVVARLAAAGARRHGTKVIYTAHGFHFCQGAPMVNWLVYYPIERLLSALTDVLITINKEDYKRAQKFSAKRVLYVPGVGVDMERFKINDIPCTDKGDGLSEEELERACLEELFFKGASEEKKYTGSRRRKIRMEFGVEDTDIMLLSVGELNANKNHTIVLDAVAGLKNPKVKYVICGKGEKEAALKQKAEALGIGGQLILAGFRNDMPEIYHAADIFVFPSLREGLPVSLMEAMASGLPVAASDIRGNADLVVHKRNGYLLPPSQVKAYEKALSLLVSSKKRREAFGKAGMELVQTFSLQEVKKRMAEIYTSCMAEK